MHNIFSRQILYNVCMLGLKTVKTVEKMVSAEGGTDH